MSEWRKIWANGLPGEGRSPKSGHRMAAEGMPFSWRWNGGTIFPNLDVIWGMSTRVVIRGIPVQGGDPTLVADEYLHPSGTPLEKSTHHGPTPLFP